MEVSDLKKQTKCVCGIGMLRVVFNSSNYSSKSAFIMTLIKQEKLVFILVIAYMYNRKYLRFLTKLFTGTRVSEDF